MIYKWTQDKWKEGMSKRQKTPGMKELYFIWQKCVKKKTMILNKETKQERKD